MRLWTLLFIIVFCMMVYMLVGFRAFMVCTTYDTPLRCLLVKAPN
jgi:hypothetical protein